MNKHVCESIRDWVPYKIIEENHDWFCRWLFLGENQFTAPFFDETIAHCRQLPENSSRFRILTSLDIIHEWSEQVESVSPSAIIFHISRCGSTLLSQMLATDPQNIVLSETPLFDEVLRKSFHTENRTNQNFLCDIIRLYGKKRNERQCRLFIKTDSWHIHYYDLLRNMFPEIPFFLLYRRADEVIRSQQKRRGMHAAPGVISPELFGLQVKDITSLTLDEYLAKVLESYLTVFLEKSASDPHAHLLNYSSGAMEWIQGIGRSTGYSFDEATHSNMIKRASFHAKYPEQVFVEEALMGELPPYQQRSLHLYNELENARLKKG